MKTVALIGDPVSHSASPAMHGAAFEACGLDMEYLAIRVRAGELEAIFPSLRERHVGLNVTRPLKRAVVPLVDELSDAARRCGAVNTVTFRDGTTFGDVTDGEGFLRAMRRHGRPPPRRAVILGTGGVARAIGFALLTEGAAITVSGRTRPRARQLADELGGDHVRLDAETLGPVVAEADLLVNATPLGGPGHEAEDPLPVGVELHRDLTVFDVVYRPRATPLLRRAVEAGARGIEGVDMLVEQGARSFEIWTGREPPVETMWAAAVRALD